MKNTPHNYQWLFETLWDALVQADKDESYNHKYQFYVQNSVHVYWPTDFLEELVVKYQLVTGLQMSAAQMRQKISNTRVQSFINMAEASKGTWAPLMRRVNSFDPQRLTKFHPDPVQLRKLRTPPRTHQTVHAGHAPAQAPKRLAQRMIHRDRTPPPPRHHTTQSQSAQSAQSAQPAQSSPSGPSSSPASSAQYGRSMQRAPPSAQVPARLPPRESPLRGSRIEQTVHEIEVTPTSLANKLRALGTLVAVSNLATVHDTLRDQDLQMAFLLNQYVSQPV